MDYQELCKGLSSMGKVQSYFKPHRRFKSNNGGEGGGPVKEIIIYARHTEQQFPECDNRAGIACCYMEGPNTGDPPSHPPSKVAGQ